MKPVAIEALIVDARLLLNYNAAVEEANSVVRAGAKMTLETQLTRDAWLAKHVMTHKQVRQLSALDVVQCFIEVGQPVIVVSQESQDVLDAIIARCDLSERTIRVFNVKKAEQWSFVLKTAKDEGLADWYLTYVYDARPLDLTSYRAILGGRGQVYSAKSRVEADHVEEQMLNLIDQRRSF